MIHHHCHIAIVGAGLAALSAAEHLITHGYNVTVIETASYVGGRVLTHHLPDDTHFELGAFSFGNGEQPLWRYIEKLALPIIKHLPMERSYSFKGWEGKMDEKGLFLNSQEQEIPLNQLIHHYRPELEKITEDISFMEALKRVGASEQAIDWLQANTLPGLLGRGFNEVSLQAVLLFLRQYDNVTAFFAIKGGNDRLPEALAQKLKKNIFLNHHVTHIEHQGEKCVLHGEGFSIEAQRIIITIPLPEITKITFTPPLSDKKQRSFEQTFYTACARISIVAPPAILGSKPGGGVFLFHDQLGWFRDQTAFQNDPSQKTVISVSVTGDAATKLEKEDWEASINSTMSRLYPKWDPKQNQTHVHFWKEGYSVFNCNHTATQNTLREFEGLIHFAGEHTSNMFSSMNGAIESGLRAAEEICHLLPSK